MPTERNPRRQSPAGRPVYIYLTRLEGILNHEYQANIIIIEDEKNICNFIETVLFPQLPGYQRQYRNRRLKLIESLKPDVVLLDLGLPDMDGLELIQEVRSTSALPIIVISARTWSAARWLPWTWEQMW